MDNVEELWKRGLEVPLSVAPIALWHLIDPQGYSEQLVLPFSEEHLEKLF